MDGVLGMSISPYKPGEDRILYYHAMSSPTENWVRTSDLRNRSYIVEHEGSVPEIFHVSKPPRSELYQIIKYYLSKFTITLDLCF